MDGFYVPFDRISFISSLWIKGRLLKTAAGFESGLLAKDETVLRLF